MFIDIWCASDQIALELYLNFKFLNVNKGKMWKGLHTHNGGYNQCLKHFLDLIQGDSHCVQGAQPRDSAAF